MSLNQVKSYVEDDGISLKNEESIFSHCGDKFLQQQQGNHLLYENMISSKQQQQQNSTVDMSAIDPIIVNYGLMSMHQKPNGTTDSVNAESILPSDSDSLLSDIDMIS